LVGINILLWLKFKFQTFNISPYGQLGMQMIRSKNNASAVLFIHGGSIAWWLCLGESLMLISNSSFCRYSLWSVWGWFFICINASFLNATCGIFYVGLFLLKILIRYTR
jgi:hypothetical protein